MTSWKAIGGGGGIGRRMNGTTQTEAASRIVMEAGTSIHEGQRQRRRRGRGGGKSGGIDGDIGSSSSQQNRKVVFSGNKWHGQERKNVTEQINTTQAATRMCAPGVALGAAVGTRSAAIGGRQLQQGPPEARARAPSDFHWTHSETQPKIQVTSHHLFSIIIGSFFHFDPDTDFSS